MLGNLADLAATGLASEPTLRKWIAAQPDQPWIIKRGSNGDAYEIDMAGAVEAWKAEEAAKLEAARQRSQELRQFGMEFGLGAGAEPEQAGLSIAERKLLLEEEVIAIKIARERGDLVAKAEIEAAIDTLLGIIGRRMGDFSARLAKKVDLPRDLQVAIDRQMDTDRAEIARKMEEMGLNGIGEPDSGPALENTAV